MRLPLVVKSQSGIQITGMDIGMDSSNEFSQGYLHFKSLILFRILKPLPLWFFRIIGIEIPNTDRNVIYQLLANRAGKDSFFHSLDFHAISSLLVVHRLLHGADNFGAMAQAVIAAFIYCD
jgi:hypothetical protein